MRLFFKELIVADRFFYNGNEYIKQSSRTALMIQYDRWFYFSQNDVVEI